MKRFLKYCFHRDHFVVTASAFIQLWILGLVVFNLSILNPVANALEDFSITDVFFDIQHSGAEPETCDLITLVDMTALHSRGDIAILLEEINQCDPLYVGVDLIFEGEKDDEIGNNLLIGAVSGLTGKSVFSSKLIDYNGAANCFTNSVRSFFAEQLDCKEAYTNLNNDMSGSPIRDFSIKQPFNGEQVLSFPARLAAEFDDSVPTIDNNELLINYKNVVFPVVPYDEISNYSDLIDGHIVLIGTIAEEQDMHNTPMGKMPGLEIQAYSLLTLLEHKTIKEIPSILTWLIAFILCYLLELALDAAWQIVKKNSKSAFMVFLKESNILSIVLLFIFVSFVCWLMFVLFIKHSICLSGGVILGSV